MAVLIGDRISKIKFAIDCEQCLKESGCGKKGLETTQEVKKYVPVNQIVR